MIDRLCVAANALFIPLDKADDALTYGSVVKLEHSESQYYLHSHQINWGSGSGQQSVTCHGGADDQGSLWVVAEANGDKFHEAGEPVPCGAKVRLTHMETRKNLHSHLFQSPLSSQQEVSCFGDKGRGDTGDNWEVVCAAKGATHWRRGEEVRFKHLDTGKQLAAEKKWAFTQRNCPNCPIVGQLEVSCARAQSAPATGWKATMGMFFHPKQPDAVNDEL